MPERLTASCKKDFDFLKFCECDNLSPNFAVPLDAEGLGPYVRIKFKSKAGEITVGNASSGMAGGGRPGSAIIKSFHYSFMAPGNASSEVTVEIYDEDGGSFEAFILDAWPKNRNMDETIADAFAMTFEWGWIMVGCGQDANKAKFLKSRPNNHAMPTGIDVEFEQGKIKFTIHANWMPAFMAHTVVSKNEGEVLGPKQKRIPLKQAIRRIFGQYNVGVLFLTRKAGPGTRPAPAQLGEEDNLVPGSFNFGGIDPGNLYEWAFHGNYEDINGKRWGWQPNQRNPIEAAMAWLQNYRTTNDKGFFIREDNSIEGLPIIVFWEAGHPDCDGSQNTSDRLNIRTYIVHGGACSPVIKFDPKITVFYPPKQQGSGLSDTGDPPATEDDVICPSITGRGEGGSKPVADDVKDQFPDNAAEEQSKSLEANEKAQVVETSAVEANLTIQGDPHYDQMLTLTNRLLTVIVVNPFHIRGAGKPGDNGPDLCGDYTAQPPCNNIFSNRNYRIEGIDHQIKEGSYHTILKLRLDAPGILMNRDVPLGGRDSCGMNYLKGRLKP